MAASYTQWKRPWSEDREDRALYQTPGPNFHPITNASTSMLQQEVSGSSPRGIGAGWKKQSNPGGQHNGFPPFTNTRPWDQNPGYVKDDGRTNYYSIPPPAPNKRPCLAGRTAYDTSSASAPISPTVIEGSEAESQRGNLARGTGFEPARDIRPGTYNDPRSFPPVPGQFVGQALNSKDTIKHNAIGREDIVGEVVTSKQCSTCVRASDVAPRIAKGLERLRYQLRIVLAQDRVSHPVAGDLNTDVTQQPAPEKLVEALDWSMEKLNETMRVAQEMLSSRASRAVERTRKPSQDESSYGQVIGGDKIRTKWEQDDRFGQRGCLQSPSTSEDGFRSQELPSIFGTERRSSLGLQSQSPTQVCMPNRGLTSLPSPSSLNFSTASNVLPPISPSVVGTGSRSPHTAHLQDLQHQLSTKSLAYQILQGEHEKLMAALTRSQTRCGALDKKSQVSDTEINNLSEDKIRLQSDMEVLEQQVEDLQQSRDDAFKQSVSSGSQYMQIMAMSSKLQAQSAADLKKWKADRDSWTEEKEKLLARIARLEDISTSVDADRLGDRQNVVPADMTGSVHIHDSERNISSGPDVEDNLSSMSSEQLRTEVVRLRKGKRESDSLVRAYREESDKMNRVLIDLGDIGQRLRRIDLGAEKKPSDPH